MIDGFKTGRWTKHEHKKFLEGICIYGNEWKRVQKHIETRSSTQARSHAQKFFLRLNKKLNLGDIKFESQKDANLNLKSFNTSTNGLKHDTMMQGLGKLIINKSR